MSATPVKLVGTPLGTPGSYQNQGETIAKAFDGDLATAFNGPTGEGNWVGLDLGTTHVITSIAYAPRTQFEFRMVGGTFQASSDPTFVNNCMTLLTVAADPPRGKLTTFVLSAPVSARYVRYVGPKASFGNIAEFQVFGVDPAGHVAVPVVIPVTPTPPATPVPAGLPGIVCGWTDAAAPTAVYAGVAPFHAHLYCPFTDHLGAMTDEGRWYLDAGYGQLPNPKHIGDPATYPAVTIDGDSSLTSPSVGVVFDQVGDHYPRYVVTHADGTTTTYVQHVQVLPDPRLSLYFSGSGNDANDGRTPATAKLTFAEMQRMTYGKVTAPNGLPWRVEILGPLPAAIKIGGGLGNVTPVAGTYFLGHTQPDGSRPKLLTAACPLFGTNAGSAGCIFRNLAITSTSPDAAGVAFALYGGDGVLVDQCDFGGLVTAVTLFAGRGLTVIRSRQTGAVKKQVVGQWGGSDVTTSFNVWEESDEEALRRVDGGTAGTRNGAEWNYEPQDPKKNGKAAGDYRAASEATEANNYRRAPATLSSAWSTTAATLPPRMYMIFADNAFDLTDSPAIAGIDVHGYAWGMRARRNDVKGPPGKCDVSVTTKAAVPDVIVVPGAVTGGAHLTPGFAPAGVTPVPVPTSAPVPVPSAAK